MTTPKESRPDAPAQDFAPYLAEASEMLASSLDYQATLTSLAHLAVPRLADWCAIDMLEEDGSIKLLAVTHKDPGKGIWGRELRRLYPPDPDAPQGVPRVLRSGKPEFYPEVTEEMLVATARDAEHLHIMREVGFTSVMILPMVARGRMIGAITLVLAESGRRYEDGDLALAEDLVQRAALAVDNARLYSEAQREIAERERAEEEARDSWSQLEVILQAIADGVTAQDATGRVIYANEEAARTLGYPSARAFLEAPLQEVMQRFEVFDDSGRPFPLEELPGRRALQGEEGIEEVLRFRVVATGEERWSVVRAMPVFDKDGRTRLAVNIFHDVTEIKQAEEELRRSEERFRSLVQHGSDIITVVDAEGTIRYVSPAVKRVVGYEPEEMVGESALDFVHPDDREEAMGLLAEVSSEPGVPPFEFRVPHKDGSWRYLEHTVNNLLDDPSVGAIVVNQRDVTGRRRAHETRLQLAAIVESSDDAIIGKTLDGIITSWNEGAERIYGYSAEETVGQPISMLVPTERPEEIPTILSSIRRGEKVDHYETVRETKDARRVDVELTVSPIRNVAGDIVGASTIARDITERTRAYELLQQRVEERTRELSTLLDVSNDVASTLELEPLLGLILDQLRTVVDYTDSSLLVFDGEDLVTVGYRGPGRPEQIMGTRFPPGPGRMRLERSGHMLESIVIDDVRSDAPLARAYRQMVGEERLGREFGHTRSWMGVPLVFKKQSIGLLAVIHEEPGHYTERHAELVRTIANQAAIAIENARLYRRAQSAAALEERQHLARELHDSVSQALYGITLGSDAALTLLERGDPDRVAEPLRYVRSLAEAGLAEMSALIFELRPESLENEGLVAALEKQTASLRARHEVEVHAALCEEPDVPLQAKETLYRIGQEALHNTVKHARAGNVELKLECVTEGIVLEINDDGSGFDPSGSFPGHLGLKSMRERAERLGGRLEIESGLGEGTRIRASVPTSR